MRTSPFFLFIFFKPEHLDQALNPDCYALFSGRNAAIVSFKVLSDRKAVFAVSVPYSLFPALDAVKTLPLTN
jgi:hypothetical protein